MAIYRLSYAGRNPYYEYLASDDVTLDGVKQRLGTHFVCAREVNFSHDCPLLAALRNKECSTDIVEHLLQYNSSINCRDMWGQNCLFIALRYSREDAIIKLLLEKGAKMCIGQRCTRLSLFCSGIHFCASKSILKLLLDTNSSLECGLHGSVMHCALYKHLKGLTEDFLDLLLSVGGDLNAVDNDGQSPLCLALQNRQDVKDIELLMRKGGSLNACRKHETPMLCVTHCRSIRTIEEDIIANSPLHSLSARPIQPTNQLTADVVDLLIKNKADISKTSSDYTPLQRALLRTQYEVEAIRLMLNHPKVDVTVHDSKGDNLLHLAVRNPYCKASVLQLLVNKGIRVDELNQDWCTPLDLALMRIQSINLLNPRIIEVLLKSGSPLKEMPDSSLSSLGMALMNNLDYHVLKLLIGAGAQVGFSPGNSTLYQIAMSSHRFENNTFIVRRLKLLIKCSYLDNPDFDFQSLCLDRRIHSEIFRFVDACKSELQRMELQNLSSNHTLRAFVSNHCSRRSSAITSSDYDQLLRILSNNVFPIYFEVIVAKIGRASMEAKLEEVPVYAFKNGTGACAKICIVLCCDSLRVFTQYLSDEELMSLIIAYFNHKGD